MRICLAINRLPRPEPDRVGRASPGAARFDNEEIHAFRQETRELRSKE
jgi:hypothetical protein